MRGAVLLEQVLAISLASLMLVGLFSLLTAGTRAAQMSEEFTLAGGLAAKKLEELAAGRDAPAAMSRHAVDVAAYPRHEWQVDVTEVDTALREVTVTVWWPQRGRERSVSLTTLLRRGDDR